MINFVFDMQINTKVLYRLILSFQLCITRNAQSTQNKFAHFCSISGKAWGLKLTFCLQINKNIFLRLIVSLWMCIARYTQSTQNNKFTISLQYLKENLRGEDDFFLLIIVGFFKMILSFQMYVARHAQITQNKTFAISLQYLKKEVNDELNFLHAGKHQSGL